MTAIRVGVIGLGRMGRNHLRVLSQLKQAELKFAFDTDPSVLDSACAAFGVPKAAELESALGDVDAVVIASPTVSHADYIARCTVQVRNIFVEKPVAHSLAAAQAIEELVERNGINLQVGFIERFNPAVRQLRRVLAAGQLTVCADFTRTNRVSSRITDVDVIADLMIHDIDLALFLNGPVRSVAAHGQHTGDQISLATTTFTHHSGALSRILASRISDKKMRLIQVTCSDKFVDCDLLRKEIVISRQAELSQPAGEPYVISATEDRLEVPPQEALQLELQAFLRSCAAVQDGLPNARDGSEAMRLCEEIRRQIVAG